MKPSECKDSNAAAMCSKGGGSSTVSRMGPTCVSCVSICRSRKITLSRGCRPISPLLNASIFSSNSCRLYRRYTVPGLSLPVRPALWIAEAWLTHDPASIVRWVALLYSICLCVPKHTTWSQSGTVMELSAALVATTTFTTGLSNRCLRCCCCCCRCCGVRSSSSKLAVDSLSVLSSSASLINACACSSSGMSL